MAKYLGIDPGKTGALAVVEQNFYAATPIPIVGIDYDAQGIISWIEGQLPIERAVIEKAQAVFLPGGRGKMYSPGPQSFQMGYGYGLLIGILHALKISFIVVSPKRWQKALGVGGNTKAGSILRVKRRFPGLELKKSQHGLADALNLADYGQFNGMDTG